MADVDGHLADQTDQITPFRHACESRGWGENTVFLAEFDRTARELGEDVSLTVRQLQRWRRPHPPRPRPVSWRVLHAMFGLSPLDLGFPTPPAVGERYEAKPLVVRRTLLGGAIAYGVVGSTFTADNRP